MQVTPTVPIRNVNKSATKDMFTKCERIAHKVTTNANIHEATDGNGIRLNLEDAVTKGPVNGVHSLQCNYSQGKNRGKPRKHIGSPNECKETWAAILYVICCNVKGN